MHETQEIQVRSLGQEDPLEEGMATHSMPAESHGERSLENYSPCTESDMTEATMHKHKVSCTGPSTQILSKHQLSFPP